MAVSYVDPNNNIKTNGGKGAKPTKEMLMPMLEHLIKKYKVSATWLFTYSVLCCVLVENLDLFINIEVLDGVAHFSQPEAWSQQ